MTDEIGMSRIYAGIHHRFDADAGLSLGRRVGRLAVQLDHDKGLLAVER